MILPQFHGRQAMRNLRLALALSALVLLTAAAGAGASIYWLNDVGAASTIGRSANDGSSPSQSFIGPLNVSEPEACGAMAIDAGHLYWSDYTDASATATSVGRAARNGTGATSALVKAGATMSCG